MSATSSSFKFIEYTGEDAADVLVNMIVHITRLELESGEPHYGDDEEPHTKTERVVGFTANPEVEPVELEEEDA